MYHLIHNWMDPLLIVGEPIEERGERDIESLQEA